jgi:ketosteroid isomerase-like protein
MRSEASAETAVTQTQPTAIQTMERLSIAWERGEYETLRALLHPNGSWALVSTETRTFTDPDEFVEAVRQAHEETGYNLFTVSHEQLTDSVLLARADVRTPARAGHGYDLARHFFLVEVRDGLFYSSRHFSREEEARSALEERGIA